MSVKGLIYLFPTVSTITPEALVHFIRRIRMQRAKELLLDAKLSISEVTYEAGFSYAFEQSPSQFRHG